jgi:uncharacterized protein (TIGR03437 family)
MLLLTLLVPAAWAQSTYYTTTSAGNWASTVAPNSIAAGFGVNIVNSTVAATSVPLSTNLGNVTVAITDSTGVTSPAPEYLVSPGQINYLIPANVAPGMAMVKVTGGNAVFTGPLQVSSIAPSIFSANMSGLGVAAGQTITVSPSGQITTQPTYQSIFTPWVNFGYVPLPISLLPAANSVYLILYGTGIRNHTTPVTATINGVSVPVLYVGPQPTQVGLDQVNLGPLPQTLTGTGKPNLNIVLLVDGTPANTTTISVE